MQEKGFYTNRASGRDIDHSTSNGNADAALARVKAQAKAVACVSQLKQFAIVWHIYTGDNGGYFQTTGDWVPLMRELAKNDDLFTCVTATKTMLDGARQPFAAQERGELNVSYGFNDWLQTECWDPDEESKMWKTVNVKKAANIPIMLDSAQVRPINPYHDSGVPEYEGDVIFGSGPSSGEMKRFCVNRHNGYTNGLFVDFSARPVGIKELWELDWHRNWNPNNDPPPLATWPMWPAWMRNFKDYYRQ